MAMRIAGVMLSVWVVASGGGIAAPPAVARTIPAADVGLDGPAQLAPSAADDFIGVHHWDVMPSAGRLGADRYYGQYGYEYTYPKNRYGYDASNTHSDEPPAEPDAGGTANPPDGTASQTVNGDSDQPGENPADVDTDASTEAPPGEDAQTEGDSTEDSSRWPHSYADEYSDLYDDGYSSDDSEEVDEPSDPGDAPEASDPEGRGYEYEYEEVAEEEEEYSSQRQESDEGYDDEDMYPEDEEDEDADEGEYEDDQIDSSEETAAKEATSASDTPLPTGAAADGQAPEGASGEESGTGDDAPSSSAQAASSSMADLLDGDSPAEVSEFYGGQFEIDGAETDPWPAPPSEESAESEGRAAVVASEPNVLGAMISMAAHALDRLGTAMCTLSRRLEAWR